MITFKNINYFPMGISVFRAQNALDIFLLPGIYQILEKLLARHNCLMLASPFLKNSYDFDIKCKMSQEVPFIH